MSARDDPPGHGRDELEGIPFVAISNDEMAALIEQSSLGTPGAKALRARTPPEVSAEIAARIKLLEETIQHRLRHHAARTYPFDPASPPLEAAIAMRTAADHIDRLEEDADFLRAENAALSRSMTTPTHRTEQQIYSDAIPLDRWKWDPELQWWLAGYPPATPTENTLLNEIDRLRAEVDRYRALPDLYGTHGLLTELSLFEDEETGEIDVEFGDAAYQHADELVTALWATFDLQPTDRPAKGGTRTTVEGPQ